MGVATLEICFLLCKYSGTSGVDLMSFGIIFQNLTRIMQRRCIEVGATYILLYTYILVVHWIS